METSKASVLDLALLFLRRLELLTSWRMLDDDGLAISTSWRSCILPSPAASSRAPMSLNVFGDQLPDSRLGVIFLGG